jgi:hypothetical protein
METALLPSQPLMCGRSWSAPSPAASGGLFGEGLDQSPSIARPICLADNPLSKVPALVTKDGTAIYDSPVICEYLDTIGAAAPLFPPTGSAPRLKASDPASHRRWHSGCRRRATPANGPAAG